MAPKAGKAKPKGKGDKKKKEEKGAANYTCPNPLLVVFIVSCEGIVFKISKWSPGPRVRERQTASFNFVYNCDKFADGEKSSAS